MSFEDLLALTEILEGSEVVTKKRFPLVARLIDECVPLDFTRIKTVCGGFIVVKGDEAYLVSEKVSDGLAFVTQDSLKTASA